VEDDGTGMNGVKTEDERMDVDSEANVEDVSKEFVILFHMRVCVANSDALHLMTE
jgi:hypothetical protein